MLTVLDSGVPTLTALDGQFFDTHRLVLGAAAVALVATGVRPVWRLVGHVATAAHEGGHALVALAVGHRVAGVRLHADGSGTTTHEGAARGIRPILIAAAGYPAPSLIGLGCAAVLASDRGPLVPLLLGLVVMAGMLILIRNVFGALVLLVAGGAFVAVLWRAGDQVQMAVAYGFTWFLLLSGVRTVAELFAVRHNDRSGRSDADRLRQLTHIPGMLWALAFAAVALAALWQSARWMLG